VRPEVDHVECARLVVARSLEQRVGDLHRVRDGDQRDAFDPMWCARSRLEGDQRPHAVADERGTRDARCVEQREQPVGDGLDRAERGAGAAPVPRQVEREHREAVVREVARLKRPHAVVVLGAVDEHDDRQQRVEGAAAGVGVRRRGVDVEEHGQGLGLRGRACLRRLRPWGRARRP